MKKYTYPTAPAGKQVDDYHGTLVPDPYRWLEDVDSPQTRQWIEAQNRLTFSFLETIPARPKIRQRLTELWDYPRRSAPFRKGGRYFQFRNTGLQNQDVLYTLDTPGEEGRLLLDPNTLSEDGTVALVSWSVSWDGRYLAYATSASGSDWMVWRVRQVETGRDLPDQIEWSKFSVAAWLPDNSGFYYTRYAAPQEGQDYLETNYHQKLYLHRLGTDQAQDELIYQRPDQKEWGFEPEFSQDGRYLVLSIWLGTDRRNRLFYRDLQGSPEFVELIPNLEAGYHFLGNDGARFYLHTDLDAPRGRVIAIDLQKPARQEWVTLIPEGNDTLERVKIIHDEFIALCLHDAHYQILRYALNGAPRGEIELPALGSILSLGDELHLYGERHGEELFYTFHSFVYPPTVYRFDFKMEATQVLFAPRIDFDFSQYQTEQVFATSRDGTRVPLFLTHKRGMQRDGQNPALLYGYGGFNISLTPLFNVSRLVWLEMGGVYAHAILRGGGEYGEAWHEAGMLQNKQNVFDDFIACAEYLIAEGITTTPRLAIEGRSNGGLLVGACLTQRPDLFGAALPAVGVMDMLRFHKFTIGWAWVSDYGSSEDPQGFRTLYAYSPYHNIHPGERYPATLITTADHDDRVVPGHSFKFAAALQAAQAGEAPVLIRVQTKAGHGFGKPTAILIEEQSDIWAFLVKALAVDG